jgi:hypothetical protein
MNEKGNQPNEHPGVLFSEANGQRTDEHLHDQMLESVLSVADEAGIRILMQTGLSRELACKLVRPSKSGVE